MDFHEILYLNFFENPSRKFKLVENRTRITATLHEDQCTFFIIFHSILLKMRNILDNNCTESQNTLCSIFFPSENRAVYELMWKNIVERVRPQMTIWRKSIACWIPKDKNVTSEYVIKDKEVP